MEIEPGNAPQSKDDGGLGKPSIESIQKHREALTRASSHVRYLSREVENLPPTIAHVIELVCMAIDNLIEVERLAFRPRPTWDADGSIPASMRRRAVQQLERALRELNPDRQVSADR
jgi:hypothetical protein